jgi:hypothetical protein
MVMAVAASATRPKPAKVLALSAGLAVLVIGVLLS